MATLHGFNETVTLPYMDYHVDWWYDEDEDEIVIEYMTDEMGDTVSTETRKAERIRQELRRRHL